LSQAGQQLGTVSAQGLVLVCSVHIRLSVGGAQALPQWFEYFRLNSFLIIFLLM
jgi:hypothetical protein